MAVGCILLQRCWKLIINHDPQFAGLYEAGVKNKLNQPTFNKTQKLSLDIWSKPVCGRPLLLQPCKSPPGDEEWSLSSCRMSSLLDSPGGISFRFWNENIKIFDAVFIFILIFSPKENQHRWRWLRRRCPTADPPNCRRFHRGPWSPAQNRRPGAGEAFRTGRAAAVGLGDGRRRRPGWGSKFIWLDHLKWIWVD